MTTPDADLRLATSAAGLDEASRRLFDRTLPVVGWGSGSVFDYFHQLHPVRLDYLVDSDATRWGQVRHGVEIVSPDRLAAAGGPAPFVIIYSSAWPEIQQALQGLGPYPSLPASAVFADASTRTSLAWADALPVRAAARRLRRANRAVVVQGPVVPAMTVRVLRALAALHPDDLIVLSTWDDTPAALLAEAAVLVDDVVTSARPASAGIQNRNLQIVSTRAGIARARACGATTILKTRTDLAVLAEGVFDLAEWWLDRVGPGTSRDYGLRGRIIVPSSYTRKYLLYHPSDMVMLGHADDLDTYWSAPLDARTGTLLSTAWMDQPLAAVNMSGNPTESYLGLEFCRAIGRPVAGTLSDSWAFYRDVFAVVDNSWFDILWLKNLSIPDAALRSGVRQTVSQRFWQQLSANRGVPETNTAAVDPAMVTLRALSGAAS